MQVVPSGRAGCFHGRCAEAPIHWALVFWGPDSLSSGFSVFLILGVLEILIYRALHLLQFYMYVWREFSIFFWITMGEGFITVDILLELVLRLCRTVVIVTVSQLSSLHTTLMLCKTILSNDCRPSVCSHKSSPLVAWPDNGKHILFLYDPLSTGMFLCW